MVEWEESFIKKLTEHAEGFEFRESGAIVYTHGTKLIDVNWQKAREWEFYPLLLWRALRGFNYEALKSGNDPIWVNPGELYTYIGNKATDYSYKDYQPTEYLTSQEQALEAALMEVLG